MKLCEIMKMLHKVYARANYVESAVRMPDHVFRRAFSIRFEYLVEVGMHGSAAQQRR